MVVRGAYNSMTPFYKWHTIKERTNVILTNCGLVFDVQRETRDELTSNGDRCDTSACGLKNNE